MIRLKDIDPIDLDNYVRDNHPEANFLQSAGWGKVYEIDGEKVFYFGLYDNEKIIGSAVVILKKAKRGAYLEIPGGPLLDWDRDKRAVKEFMSEIRKVAEANQCVFVRMRPNIPDDYNNQQLVKELGLVPSPMHLHAEHTVMLDLNLSEEELLKDMRRQTRYEVRRACDECGKLYFIPNASQGLPMSTFPGVYEATTKYIDQMSAEMFPRK